MFKSARLTLTAWYLAIIMVISIAFSLMIYRVLLIEVIRFERAQRVRIERRMQFFNSPIPVSLELIEEIKQRLIFRLFMVNIGIMVISGGLGYFLAGRTLKPIKEMVDEQNRFISDASHELRTPLTSLKSAMEVHLRDKKLNISQARKLISDNINDVNKLEKLTDALLVLSVYQKTNQNYEFTKLKINEVMKEAMHKVNPLAKKKNIDIKYYSQNIEITGIKQKLVDLMVIILDNAVKYTPRDKNIEITTKRTDGYVLIAVKDEGIGIAKKDLPFIFDRFYRSEEGRAKTNISGYGLGLSIAKKIVELHNGKINAKSKENAGSVFTVLLPFDKSNLIN